MQYNIQIRINTEDINNQELICKSAAKQLNINPSEITGFLVQKRSLDARRNPIKFQLDLIIYVSETPKNYVQKNKKFHKVHRNQGVLIIGAGPAGYFAALKCLETGLKPIIFERGKMVRDRRRDLAAISKNQLVNPDSNYCFGEGGAGTYSDGKLYTRSKKRGSVAEVLELFIQHGAENDINIDAHPHIGTNKLPGIIEKMREQILEAGGEIHFNSKVVDFLIDNNKIKGLLLENGKEFFGEAVILATGHSARDIYSLFYEKKWAIEYKTFAVGLRVEHPQRIIDKIQYRKEDRGEYLPPAAYKLVKQIGGYGKRKTRGVYSFCMCPGGIIAPCATQPGEIVTNGWSPSKRNNPFANSGIVVGIEESDCKHYAAFGPLAGMKFQEELEKKAWEAGGKTQAAPAQRLLDFINQKTSIDLPKCSYMAGVKSYDLNKIFPKWLSHYLRNSFVEFGKNMKSFLTNEAIVVGVESRSSAPVRIPRDKESLEHTEIENLYPCGEGAGYAGGIVSAAIDGMRCVEKIAEKIAEKTL